MPSAVCHQWPVQAGEAVAEPTSSAKKGLAVARQTVELQKKPRAGCLETTQQNRAGVGLGDGACAKRHKAGALGAHPPHRGTPCVSPRFGHGLP